MSDGKQTDLERAATEIVSATYDVASDSGSWVNFLEALANGVSPDGHGSLREATDQSSPIAGHLARSIRISDQLNDAQNDLSVFRRSIDELSFGIALWDGDGKLIHSNNSMQVILPELENLDKVIRHFNKTGASGEAKQLRYWVNCEEAQSDGVTLHSEGIDGSLFLFVASDCDSGDMAKTVRRPLLVYFNIDNRKAVRVFGRNHGLTDSEIELVASLFLQGDLRTAALHAGLTYETARTYLKRILSKTDSARQSELLMKVISSSANILSLVNQGNNHPAAQRVRLCGANGRDIEYFSIGPEGGYPVVLFQGHCTRFVNIVGESEICSRILREYNIRIIQPIFPGMYGSRPSYDKYAISEFVCDINEILQSLKLQRFSILAGEFSAAMGLTLASEFGNRVDRLLLSSPYFTMAQRAERLLHNKLYFALKNLMNIAPRISASVSTLVYKSMSRDPGKFLKALASSQYMSVTDRELFANPVHHKLQCDGIKRITSNGGGPLSTYFVEMARLSEVKWTALTCNVEVYQGGDDKIAPPMDTEKLFENINNSKLFILPGQGHFHGAINWPWLLARAGGRNVATGAITSTADGARLLCQG